MSKRKGLSLELQCRAASLPEPVREYRFAPPRRWRFDCAWPPERLALEIEGGAWIGGRHTRGAGYVKDLDKYNRATLDGWKLLRVTPQQVANGHALYLLEVMLRARSRDERSERT